MDLPSFLWLWKIAAWSMGLSLTAYVGLVLTGGAIAMTRRTQQPRPAWWRGVHLTLGLIIVLLVTGLLIIGVIGTLGEYGTLGHSIHGLAGLSVVSLTLASTIAAWHIQQGKPWARTVHISINGVLGMALLWVLGSGWIVVQKYLP